VLDWQRRKGKPLEFLVKWKGYSLEHNTWEPSSSLVHAPEAMARFAASERQNGREVGKYLAASKRKRAATPGARVRRRQGGAQPKLEDEDVGDDSSGVEMKKQAEEAEHVAIFEPLQLEDLRCTICLDLFCQPYTFPCKHSLCSECALRNAEFNDHKCPLGCMHGQKLPARRCLVVNQVLWRQMQAQFPEECAVRLARDSSQHPPPTTLFLALRWAIGCAPLRGWSLAGGG
jgi:hypothetical protein